MKIEKFVKLMTGHFDNKEQFEAMKNAGKAYPYAQHVNTICNDKIKNLPEDFNGIFADYYCGIGSFLYFPRDYRKSIQ